MSADFYYQKTDDSGTHLLDFDEKKKKWCIVKKSEPAAVLASCKPDNPTLPFAISHYLALLPTGAYSVCYCIFGSLSHSPD